MWETGLEWAEAKIQAKLEVSLGQTLAGTEMSWRAQRGDPNALLLSQLSHPTEVTPKALLPQPGNTQRCARGGSSALQAVPQGSQALSLAQSPCPRQGVQTTRSCSSFTLHFTWGSGFFK